MSDKIYAPINVKARDGRFGQEFRISFNVEKMLAFIKQHQTAKGYVNLSMTARREVSKFGETHSVVVDTWEPNQSRRAEPVSGDDVPW